MKDIQHNKRIASQIESMLASGRMGHAFLFVGGSSETRLEIGRWLSAKVLCKSLLDEQKFEHDNHEDFILCRKPDDKETLTVSVIDELIEKLRFKPFGTSYAVVIEDAHLMRQEAQNKLLKTLEEPTTQALIILLSERLEAVLPTVQSRCNTYILEDADINASESADKAAESFLNLLRKGAPYYKKKSVFADIIADKDSSRERALEFLDIFEAKLEKELLSGADDVELLSKAIKEAETSRKYLKQVHSVAYTLKQLCLRV